MYIKSIDIENFGNFSKAHFDFSSDINSIIQENGYGKSTICAFIKAMFYGLDERGKKTKDPIFERERYFPWSKQKYGGSLIFSFKDKDYKVIRFFDEKKSSNDTFELYDEQTKKQIVNFIDDSKENTLGQKIFGINKESFERSCFVNLDALKVPALNDDISGKLNNILQAEDDIGNFEKTKEKITKQIRNLNGTGKATKKSLLEEEIKEIKNEILDIESIESSLPKLENFIDTEKNDVSNLKNELQKIEQEKNNVFLYEQQKNFVDKKDKLKNIDNQILQLKDFFCNSIPNGELINSIKNLNTEFLQAELELKNNNITDVQKETFSELQKFFYPNVPSLEQLEEQQSLLNQKKQILQNSSDLKLQNIQKIDELENQKKQIEDQIKTLENQKQSFDLKVSKTKLITILLSVFSSIAFLSFGFIFLKNVIFSIIFFSCAALFLLLGIVLRPKNNFDNFEKLNLYKDELKKIEQQIQTYRQNNLNDSNKGQELNLVEQKLKTFIAEYKQKCNTEDVDEILVILRKKLSIYENLSKTIPRYENAKTKSNECKEKLLICLKEYKTNKALSFDVQIEELQKNYFIYQTQVEELSKLKSEIEQFEQNHDMKKILQAKESNFSSDKLQNDIKNVQEQIQKKSLNIKSYQEQLEQKYLKVDKKGNLENMLLQKQNEKKELEQRVYILEKTIDYLSKAKESLSIKYMGKMQTAFLKYVKALDDKKNILINSDLQISIEGCGSLYDINYLSEGYKDLVNFCTRLALVDAMFEDENPVLVLDDPFINLDENKIQNALKVLKEVSKAKQIIYFTCHKSRIV